MKPCTTEFLAWAAGFFDGEGAVFIHKRTSPKRNITRGYLYVRHYETYNLQARIGQCVRRPLDDLKEAFGGNIYVNAKRVDNQRTVYVWVVASGTAERFIRAVRPFLRLKQAEADIAIRFRETFQGNPKRAGLRDGVLAERASLRDELHGLPERRKAVRKA